MSPQVQRSKRMALAWQVVVGVVHEVRVDVVVDGPRRPPRLLGRLLAGHLAGHLARHQIVVLDLVGRATHGCADHPPLLSLLF